MSKENQGGESGIASLSEARARTQAARVSLERELEDVRLLLDQGLTSEVLKRTASLMRASRQDATLLARARCLLSAALEMQGRYRESLEAVQMYEQPEERAKCDPVSSIYLGVQLGLAYNYTGDHPKAIALLNATLREATEHGGGAQVGSVYVALARVYRNINEYTIARDHAQKALEHFRGTGDWRGLAEANFGIALAEVYEGNYEPALEHFGQALKLVGDHPAPYLLGKLYTNMAGVCWFLKRPHDGIKYLETAISYYERTEHKANAADGYNNLGIHLILVGQWDRAQEALERALTLASETDKRGEQTMILDSLGELLMLRGELEEAEKYLERAVELSQEHGNKWYIGQALRTLGRCHLAMNELERALADGTRALEYAGAIGDRQAVCDSRLLLGEIYLRRGDLARCEEQLNPVLSETADTSADFAVSGEAQRLHGLLSLAQGERLLAAQHFGRSVSIYEMLGDRYRSARSRYDLGRAYAAVQPERAYECLTRAAETFRELGAQLDITRAEEALGALAQNPAGDDAPAALQPRFDNLTHLILLRLTDAVASRELLLRELAAVISQETDVRRILIAETDEEGRSRVVVAHGWTEDDGGELLAKLRRAEGAEESKRVAGEHQVELIELRPANAPPATLLVSPPGATTLPGGISFDPLLRMVELGLDVCAFREQAREGLDGAEQSTLASQSFMPGFIHSSPAMTRLVEEVHKIRSSDVTVLVTGESGTGKELVARAIHALSSRRAKVFVPFNCTAVPKELSDAYLFGYRRGAFTGAVSDSPGVIRSAAGGTLFLDEIGDLPLDIQPKLLRFLQEGEIQPLGEQRPAKVDVRIIAATNSDLEDMVKDGRFREDLYYRLNVIRLRVPPLRERRSEIPTLVNHYIGHYAQKFNRRDIRITPETIDLLMVCDWPGNIRQLVNEIQRIMARAEDGTLITPDHLSPELKRTSAPVSTTTTHFAAFSAPAAPETLSLPDAVEDLERRMIADSLRRHKGNISRAARELGITRRGLQLKLGRYAMSATS
ncbi:MAG TPA: sigma 54-interacting transcriptional regulator [Pyrinomonadaceae bacterium]|jgi:DNA-binding NtrC family response regulator/tetratricopeptide (TPR) repeat protein|nr:sigma 54-interacting transcriptional regulator [Pyrinomonadaceae bacterium]